MCLVHPNAWGKLRREAASGLNELLDIIGVEPSRLAASCFTK